ncbi:hypothetical protein CO116_00015 [Candidatus Falkowbacteria bacterium CG_4_9_14_3_um_filter_38_19]|uniref:GIY-YIG domain-containing protein n=2 Tax=Candidatus Falkowiibacteriota TaxID=1752728 RepID=A0A2M6WRV2_9BACT|nr:MAG: hypothetical protein COT96_00825 [Candidatus Falkowbacteria bacterium CG10_big_fil_rev_8_21_14_0_10_38_22]PJB18432.1 MAG: hypothetical protein CO116_00015 [Candidatus Falkowbacteria bacterium CG_4_9_14_3_um_filter_38_19]
MIQEAAIQLFCHCGLEPQSRKNIQEEKYYYIYIEASCKNGTLYIGVTNNILDRDNYFFWMLNQVQHDRKRNY